MNRRTFVGALAASSALALAGCSDGEDESGEEGIDNPEDHDEAEGDDPDTTDRDDEIDDEEGTEDDLTDESEESGDANESEDDGNG